MKHFIYHQLHPRNPNLTVTPTKVPLSGRQLMSKQVCVCSPTGIGQAMKPEYPTQQPAARSWWVEDRRAKPPAEENTSKAGGLYHGQAPLGRAKAAIWKSNYPYIEISMKYITLISILCSYILFSLNSFATECPSNWKTLHPAWIWCDDFEMDKTTSYFEKTGPFNRTAGIGLNNSYGMKATWTSGISDAGSLKLAFGLTPPSSGITPPAGVDTTTKFRDVYYRVYLKSQTGWNSSNQSKFTRATSFVAADWSQSMIAHLWSNDTGNNNYLRSDPASCVSGSTVQCSGYNDFAHINWLGGVNGTTAVFTSPNAGSWNCIEAHVKLNDSGSSNGIEEFWIDGHLEASSNNLNFVSSYSGFGINAILLENYINNGAPQAQSRYWDNLVVSTQRIECSATESPLVSPANLRVVE